MAEEFYGRCNCKKRRPSGAKSSFLQEADAAKVNANAASELIIVYSRGSLNTARKSGFAFQSFLIEEKVGRMPGIRVG